MSPDTRPHPKGSMSYQPDRPSLSSSPKVPSPYVNGPRHLPQARQPHETHSFDPGGRLVEDFYHDPQQQQQQPPQQPPATQQPQNFHLNTHPGMPPTQSHLDYHADPSSLPPIQQQPLNIHSHLQPSHQVLPTTYGDQPNIFHGPNNSAEFQRHLSARYPQLKNMCDEHNEPYGLIIRQQPQRGLVAQAGKEKNRKPLDPPLFVEFRVPHHLDPFQLHLVNTGLFAFLQLYRADIDEPFNKASTGDFIGTIVSSIHKFKGPNDRDGAWMIWGDLSCCRAGRFRLKVTLMERHQDSDLVTEIQSVTTEPFDVMQPKEFPGLDESTYLTRSFADQGAKVRIRKEPNRNRAGSKRSMPQDILLHAQTSPARSSHPYGYPMGFPSDHIGSEDSPTKRVRPEELARNVSSPWPGSSRQSHPDASYFPQATASMYAPTPSARAGPPHTPSFSMDPSVAVSAFDPAITGAWPAENIMAENSYLSGPEPLSYQSTAHPNAIPDGLGLSMNNATSVNLNHLQYYNTAAPNSTPPNISARASFAGGDLSPEQSKNLSLTAQHMPPSSQQ